MNRKSYGYSLLVISCVLIEVSQSLRMSSFHSACPTVRIVNGRVKYRQRGRFAKFSCNLGYMVAGDRYSICSNGQWDARPPKCVRATCANNNPQIPTNGLIYPSHSGAVLNIYCRPGYQLRGPMVIYCDGRQWDNHMPACLVNGTKPKLFCDFEDPDICGWTHDLNHDFEWRRENYRTPSWAIGTGPSFDHTKGRGQSGFYMYIESSSRSENDTARLVSPIFDKTTADTCLEFYYHMYGSTTGTLRVYLRKASDGWSLQSGNAIFSKSGNQGDKWYRSFHSLGIIDEDFQIIIEGVRGPGYVSDIAIDDVRIIENCEDEDYTTTTEMVTETEILATIESCENRCGAEDNRNRTNLLITCDCDASCVDSGRCCPDFFDVCALSASTASEDYLQTTTDFPNDIQSQEESIEQHFKVSVITQTIKTPIKTTEVPIRTTTTIKTEPTIKKAIKTMPTQRTTTTTSKTIQNITSKKTTNTPKINLPKNIPTQLQLKTTKLPKLITNISVINRPTIILEKPKPTPNVIRKIFTTTKPTTKVVLNKIHFIKPKPTKINNNDVIELPKNTDNKEFLMTSPETLLNNEKVDDSFYAKENYAEKVAKKLDSTNNKILAENEKLFTEKGNSESDETSRTLTLIGVIGSTIAALSILFLTIILMKRKRFNRCRTRKMTSSNGDSQSDVRFLTEDETLDFSLDASYDDL